LGLELAYREKETETNEGFYGDEKMREIEAEKEESQGDIKLLSLAYRT